MLNSMKTRTRHALKIGIAFTPWVLSMYAFYWLESSGTWASDTPHRGKISVAILVTGMALSLLLKSHFDQRERK